MLIPGLRDRRNEVWLACVRDAHGPAIHDACMEIVAHMRPDAEFVAQKILALAYRRTNLNTMRAAEFVAKFPRRMGGNR